MQKLFSVEIGSLHNDINKINDFIKEDGGIIRSVTRGASKKYNTWLVVAENTKMRV